jgi:hypothetical protein
MLNRHTLTQSLLAAALLSLAALPFACLADKPAAGSPVRKELAAAVRGHQAFKDLLQSHRLDIRLLQTEGDLAYMCALLIDEQSQHHHQDGMVTVLQVVLRQQVEANSKRWAPVATVDGLAQNARDVQCLGDEQGTVTRAFMEGLAANPALGLRTPGGTPR